MFELDTKETLLNKLIEDYKNKKRSAITQILKLLKDDIAKLLENDISIKLAKEVVEEKLQIKIRYDTFYKFIKREFTQKTDTKKEVVEVVEVAKEEKKETKNDTTEVVESNDETEVENKSNFAFNLLNNINN